MPAIVGTKTLLTEFGGQYKELVISATLTTASDVITLTPAAHGCSVIKAVKSALIISGQATTFTGLYVSFTGLAMTVVSLGQDGNASSSWGNVVITLDVY